MRISRGRSGHDARDRGEAIERGRRALSEFVIDGIRTTIPFHLGILDDDGFRRGEYHTEYLPQLALA